MEIFCWEFVIVWWYLGFDILWGRDSSCFRERWSVWVVVSIEIVYCVGNLMMLLEGIVDYMCEYIEWGDFYIRNEVDFVVVWLIFVWFFGGFGNSWCLFMKNRLYDLKFDEGVLLFEFFNEI